LSGLNVADLRRRPPRALKHETAERDDRRQFRILESPDGNPAIQTALLRRPRRRGLPAFQTVPLSGNSYASPFPVSYVTARPVEAPNPWHTWVEVSSFMKMMHLAAVACLVLTGHTVRLWAECAAPPPMCEAAARADLVFFGEVLEQTTYVEYTERGTGVNGIQAVRFNVIRAYKGVKPSQWWWGQRNRSSMALDTWSSRSGAQQATLIGHAAVSGSSGHP